MGSTSLNLLSGGAGVWSLSIYPSITPGHLWKDVQKSTGDGNTRNISLLSKCGCLWGSFDRYAGGNLIKGEVGIFSSFLCITNKLFTGCTVVPVHKLCPLSSRAHPIASGLLAPLSCIRQGKQQSLGIPFKSARLQRHESMPRTKVVSHFQSHTTQKNESQRQRTFSVTQGLTMVGLLTDKGELVREDSKDTVTVHGQ